MFVEIGNCMRMTKDGNYRRINTLLIVLLVFENNAKETDVNKKGQTLFNKICVERL